MDTQITVNLAPPYPITIGAGLLKKTLFAEICKTTASRLAVITDSTVNRLYKQQFQDILQSILSKGEILFLEFPAGERHKTRETKQLLEDKMLAAGCNRDTCILALGGGVVSDVAGFIAATYCRGIPMLSIPTTLLAMVDASVGGKTAINTSYGKNMIGCFYQPQAVIMDIDFLQTLPYSEMDNGLAEMLKHALIQDAHQFSQLSTCSQDKRDEGKRGKNEQHWLLTDREWFLSSLAASVNIKKKIVEQDERDLGIRQILNFGHSIGHAIEQLSDYTVPHGQAVAIGMWVESYLSMSMGFLPASDFRQIETSLQMFHFSLKGTWLQDWEQVLHVLQLDKKNDAKELRFVLLEGLGKPYKDYVFPISREALKDALQEYNHWIKQC